MQEIDKKLIDLLGDRMNLSNDLGNFKKEKKLKVVDKNREFLLFKFWQEKGEKKCLSQKFIERIWKLILKESIRIQREVR